MITSDENIGTQNQITELDNDKLYYTIENASEEIQALQPGDILTYEYEPGYFLIARILDISVNGSTVRIHGDETLDIDDVFDVIKIGTTATTEDFTVNESALPSNIEYGGLVPVDDMKRMASAHGLPVPSVWGMTSNFLTATAPLMVPSKSASLQTRNIIKWTKRPTGP